METVEKRVLVRMPDGKLKKISRHVVEWAALEMAIAVYNAMNRGTKGFIDVTSSGTSSVRVCPGH